MKNPVQMLKDIKNLLGVELSETKEKEEIVLAQLNLDNGTKLESENFEVGNEVFILTEDEKVALPVGEYKLEDGRTLEITEDGIINSIEVKAEESPEEEKEEEEMEEDKYPTREEFDALKEMVQSMKDMMGEKKEEEEEELKAELSKPATQPIKHTPEQKEVKKVLHSQRRGNNTLDRVMNKILNK
tara:strand:+ start:11405 stop:11962 length:558 start_codon:yes stop_codon:yes gene_type:complete